MPVAVQAQLAVGSWKIYSPFINVEGIAETGTYVYYISSGSVFRYDKETSEVESLTRVNILNDVDASGLFVDNARKSVIVSYKSGNMDRLFDDGRNVNIPDIKNANNVGSHVINEIAFIGKDKYYVATDFGLVVYDNNTNKVNETLFTQNAIKHIDASENMVGIVLDNVQCYVAPLDKQLKKLSDFTSLGTFGMADCHGLAVINDKLLWCLWGEIFIVDNIDLSSGTFNIHSDIPVDGVGTSIRDCNNWKIYRGGNGYRFAVNPAGCYAFGQDGNGGTYLPNIKVPASTMIYYSGDDASVWEGSSDGLRLVDYSSATPKELTGYIKGSDLRLKEVHAMHTGVTSGKIYLYGLDQHDNFNAYYNRDIPSTIQTFKDGVFTDVTGYELEIDNSNSGDVSRSYPLRRNHRLCEDPQDPDAYYVGTFFEGIYHIKNNKQIHKYYANNVGFEMLANYACNVYAVEVDNYGNLWAYNAEKKNSDAGKRIYVLPAELRSKESTVPSDWHSFAVKGMVNDNWENFLMPCRKSNYVIVLLGKYMKTFGIIDSKGTPSPSDDRLILVDTEIDQDGKEFDSTLGLTWVTEDNNGRLWFGSDKGVFEISDISKVTSNIASIKRMKVARNDGTNLADYLLDNVLVSGIAVDAANKKWISTIGSGVYYVSENGDKILEHFTTDNSILPSNHVYSVACDPNSNKVYFGTTNGLVEYSSTTAPAADSYSDVYAYPNPVRPDYTGWITVTGLMANSLVKIADANGNVLHQGRSDGGMFVWDGCNSAGERVKTGVYYVLASQNATGSSSACVTKIMVIN